MAAMQDDLNKPVEHLGGYYPGYDYHHQGDYGGAPNRNLGDYWLMLRERIWWLITAVFVVFTGSCIHSCNATPIYRSSATVRVLRQEDRHVQFDDVVDQTIRNEEDFNTQIKILSSNNIIKRVKDRFNEEETRRFMAPYEDLVSFRGPLTPQEVLSRNCQIVPLRLSLVVSIQYSHPDKAIAARVANLFAEEFINYNLNLRIEGSMRAVEDLRTRAEQQRDKVEEIELQLADFKEKHKSVSLDVRSDIDQQELLQLNEMLTNDRKIFDEVETRWNMVSHFNEQEQDLWELSFIANSPHVSSLLSQISVYKIQIGQLSKRYRDKHPQMIETRRALEEAEKELQESVSSSADKIYSDYLLAKKNYDNSELRIAQKQQEIIELEKLRVKYHSAVRNLTVNQEMFHYFYSRMQQAMTLVNEDVQTAHIVDKASPALYPYKPRHLVNLSLGLFGGFVIGIGLVFFIAFIDDRIKTAFDIETLTGLPLIGIIPRIKKLGDREKAQIVIGKDDEHTTEAFRSIYSAFKLNEGSKKAKCILTTSTIPNEGKSFVTTNLALTFADHGERTIVVDCDLRMPNVAKSFDLKTDEGLINYFNGNRDLEEVIVKEVHPNLDILPSGGKLSNPTQILSSHKFENLIHELRMRYDKIIFDTPPLAPVSDAFNILPLVDGVLYIIKFNAVKRKTAKLQVRRIWESNIPILGAVLNNITVNTAGYYYSQYYDKSYESYYSLDGDEKKLAKTAPKEVIKS